MASNDDKKDGPAPRPEAKRKVRRKKPPALHLIPIPGSRPVARRPINVPATCQLKPDGSLHSPWREMAYEAGHNPGAPRAPEVENNQEAPVPIGHCREDMPTANARGASAEKRATPSKKKKAASPTYTHIRDQPESCGGSEDGFHSDQASDGSPEKAYQYGAGDDDMEDEYATIYDGDDQGAKVRRY